MKILDAGWGKQGFFTLVSDNDHLFIHYNKESEGYSVFQLNGTDEHQAQAINRHLADVIEQGQLIKTSETPEIALTGMTLEESKEIVRALDIHASQSVTDELAHVVAVLKEHQSCATNPEPLATITESAIASGEALVEILRSKGTE